MASKKKTITVTTNDIPETLSEHPFYGIELDEEQKVMANTIWNPNIDIVFVNAKAGCGKTIVATGVANLLV